MREGCEGGCPFDLGNNFKKFMWINKPVQINTSNYANHFSLLNFLIVIKI